MYIGFMYIPIVLAEQLSQSAEYSGSAAPPRIKKVGATEEPPIPPTVTPATQPKSDPTTTILWIGALTSVGGLGIQYAQYRNEVKKRKG